MSKISAYPELVTVAGEDLLVIVDDPAGTPTTKKISRTNLVAGLAASSHTHAISDVTSLQSSLDGKAALTRISGSSGAAGADLTWQELSANATANATTTLQTVMTTTSVGAGTWAFKYRVIYQAAATTTGVDFAVNHTGTVTKMVASSWLVTTGGAAATGVGDQVGSNTASLAEGKSARAINTKFGSTLGVDTINADMLYVIEGVIVVSATGSLELKHASEVAASTQVMANTCLELQKVA